MKQSTFLAATKSDLLSRSEPVPAGVRAQAAKAILGLIDGSRTAADIVDQVDDPAALGFASRNHLESFVQKVASLVG